MHCKEHFFGRVQVGPRLKKDKDNFPPNNILMTLAGAGLLWLGWSGFNGGSALAANVSASIAILNTHVCTATSLLVWISLDIIFLGKPSVIGAVQGMTTGLVCITPAAGMKQPSASPSPSPSPSPSLRYLHIVYT